MEGNVLQSSGHFVFDKEMVTMFLASRGCFTCAPRYSRKIPHKNHVTLDNDIIAGGGLKSSDVYAEGREKCG